MMTMMMMIMTMMMIEDLPPRYLVGVVSERLTDCTSDKDDEYGDNDIDDNTDADDDDDD